MTNGTIKLTSSRLAGEGETTELMGCIVEFCCWVCVCVFVLAGNQFVFVFLCLVDKKGQENARKSGHVF